MTSFLKTLRQSVDNLRRDRSSSLRMSQNTLTSESELPREEDIDFQYRITTHCNGCVIWNHKMYLSNQEEILRVDAELQLHQFGVDEINTIVACSDFGKIVRGLRGITVFKNYLLSWHETGSIVLWSENEQIVMQFEAHLSPITNVIVWNDKVVTRSRDIHEKIKVWQVRLSDNNAECVLTLDDQTVTSLVAWNNMLVTLSPKTERSDDSSVKVYDSKLNKINTFFVEGTHVKHIYPWQNLLICACEDGLVYLLNYEGAIELKVGSEGTSDVWAFCIWKNRLVFCDAILKSSFNLSQGVIEMWNTVGECEYRLKTEHAALELIPWDDLLVARTCDSIVVYKDNTHKKEKTTN